MFNFFQKKLKKTGKPYIHSYGEQDSLGKHLASREKVDLNFLLGVLPDPDEILTNTGNDLSIYRKLMLDSQVRACVNSRKAGTMSLEWEINRGKAKSRQVKLIEDIYANIDIDALNSAILNAPMFGLSPIEIMWGKVGNFIVPVDLVAKNPEWFTFDIDNKLRLLTMGNSILGEELPDRKFLTPTYNDINNNYYNPFGDRVLSSCFWPVTFKKSGFKWWVTFTEKYGMPYLIGKMPRGGPDSERTSMLNNLKEMVMDAVAVISDDSSIEFNGVSGTNNADLYDKLITKCDESIAKAILGQTLTTDGNQGGSGSYALGKVHNGVRQDIVDSDKKIVERTHNQLIRWIWEINFNSGEVPTFSMFEEEDVDKVLAERDQILTNTGVKFSKQYFIKTYGLEEKDFEISEEKKPDGLNEDFAEGDFVLDSLMKNISDKEMQEQAKELIKPAMDLINGAKDYNEILEGLSEVYPDMKTNQLQDKLTKVIFISEILGRIQNDS